MAVLRAELCITLIISSVITADGATSYWGADNRIAPSAYGGAGRFYIRHHVYEPEYYYPDEEKNNQIGQSAKPGPVVYPASGRQWDSGHWRHRAQAPQTGRATVTQRHHGKTGKIEFPQRRTTGLFRSSQWGSATVPYKGAKVNVPVLSGKKKRIFSTKWNNQRCYSTSSTVSHPTPYNTHHRGTASSLDQRINYSVEKHKF